MSALLTASNLTPVPSGRLPAIDVLKGSALLLVLSYHAGGVLQYNNVIHGEAGVDVFLLISGFMLALRAGNRSAGDFLSRRFSRIFPAYWMALSLFLLLDWAVRNTTWPWQTVALHYTGLHAFGPEKYFFNINDSFWFISLIVPLYLVFLAIRSMTDRIEWVVVSGAFLTVGACLVYASIGHNAGLIHAGIRIPTFFAGVVAGSLMKRPAWNLPASWPLAAALMCVIYLTFTKGIQFSYTLAALVISYFIITVYNRLQHTPGAKQTFAILQWLGVYSYEIFLLHQPLIREYNVWVLSHVFHVPAPTPMQLGLGVLAGLALATAAAVPLHHLSARLFARKQANPAT